jgi:hypothetical protein
MNIMNVWKGATFMPYPIENKGRLSIMNVGRRYFVWHVLCQTVFSTRVRQGDTAKPVSSGQAGFQSLNRPIAKSPILRPIPCSIALTSQNLAIHAAFHAFHEKIPCYFPCYLEFRHPHFNPDCILFEELGFAFVAERPCGILGTPFPL